MVSRTVTWYRDASLFAAPMYPLSAAFLPALVARAFQRAARASNLPVSGVRVRQWEGYLLYTFSSRPSRVPLDSETAMVGAVDEPLADGDGLLVHPVLLLRRLERDWARHELSWSSFLCEAWVGRAQHPAFCGDPLEVSPVSEHPLAESAAQVRRTALLIGRRYSRAGIIREAGDLFFLTPTEIEQAALAMHSAEWKAIVARRIRIRERQLLVRPAVAHRALCSREKVTAWQPSDPC